MNSSRSTMIVEDEIEGWGQKFSRKFKENPWVPLGCLATCGALVMASVKLRAGQSQQMNYWLRARVVLQGVTLVALVAGSMAYKSAKREEAEAMGILAGLPNNEMDTEMMREKKREREREEFENRLRGAQLAHDEEMELKTRRMTEPVVKTETSRPSAEANEPSSPSEKAQNSTGWNWLGIWRSSSDTKNPPRSNSSTKNS